MAVFLFIFWREYADNAFGVLCTYPTGAKERHRYGPQHKPDPARRIQVQKANDKIVRQQLQAV